MHQSTAVRKKWFVSNYLSSWNFSKMYCPQPRLGWFKWKHFNKPVWQLLAKTLNRKQVNAKTLWFIYIKILVCHLHIFIVIYSLNFVKMISSGCFFRFYVSTLWVFVYKGAGYRVAVPWCIYYIYSLYNLHLIIMWGFRLGKREKSSTGYWSFQ